MNLLPSPRLGNDFRFQESATGELRPPQSRQQRRAFGRHAFRQNPRETCVLKNSLLLLAPGNADTLPSASAISNDICLLQKAANGKKLSLTEASI